MPEAVESEVAGDGKKKRLGRSDLAVGAGLSGTGAWRQLADHERFYGETSRVALAPVEADLTLPALGCGLWVSDE